jgi:hypothetical protein
MGYKSKIVITMRSPSFMTIGTHGPPMAPFEIVVVIVLLGRWKGPLDHEAKAWPSFSPMAIEIDKPVIHVYIYIIIYI